MRARPHRAGQIIFLRGRSRNWFEGTVLPPAQLVSHSSRRRGLLPCVFIHIGTKAAPDISILLAEAAIHGRLIWSP
jgi:hypothetical protein